MDNLEWKPANDERFSLGWDDIGVKGADGFAINMALIVPLKSDVIAILRLIRIFTLQGVDNLTHD